MKKYILALLLSLSVSVQALNEENREKTLRSLCSFQSSINLAVGEAYATTQHKDLSLEQLFPAFYRELWHTPHLAVLDWVFVMTTADTAPSKRFRTDFLEVTPADLKASWIFALENYRPSDEIPEDVIQVFEDLTLPSLKQMILDRFEPDENSYGNVPSPARLFYRQELRRVINESNLWVDADIQTAVLRFVNERGQTIVAEYDELLAIEQSRLGAEHAHEARVDHRIMALEQLKR